MSHSVDSNRVLTYSAILSCRSLIRTLIHCDETFSSGSDFLIGVVFMALMEKTIVAAFGAATLIISLGFTVIITVIDDDRIS